MPITLTHLERELQIAGIEVWMGLLLGGFELTQTGEFYDDVWITASPDSSSGSTNSRTSPASESYLTI